MKPTRLCKVLIGGSILYLGALLLTSRIFVYFL